jgi:hypothetical protein
MFLARYVKRVPGGMDAGFSVGMEGLRFVGVEWNGWGATFTLTAFGKLLGLHSDLARTGAVVRARMFTLFGRIPLPSVVPLTRSRFSRSTALFQNSTLHCNLAQARQSSVRNTWGSTIRYDRTMTALSNRFSAWKIHYLELRCHITDPAKMAQAVVFGYLSFGSSPCYTQPIDEI